MDFTNRTETCFSPAWLHVCNADGYSLREVAYSIEAGNDTTAKSS